MALLSLADVLIDFGKRDEPKVRAVDEFPAFERAQPVEAAETGDPAPDIDAIVAEAVAKAEAEFAARLEAEHEERLAAERESHAGEVEALNQRLGEELATRIEASFGATEGRLLDLTAEVMSRILGTILTEDLQQRSVEQLGNIIRTAIREAGTVRVKVRGPLSLYEPLTEKLGDLASMLEFSETSGLDLTVELDEGVYETRLAEWSKAAAEVLS
ncbi:hypothetical protein FQ775_21345 [Nitratireductor mangrovi]|uniref:Flagellar assembly protein FliH/Type III secretion system HrpE domain-containing protein n=1 Tax=Nitratireductor mangrovi TaxID=2599600 RepID=A0A5B8L3Z0_9HYPH|nr:hypothetical protein [Nitratireductor mangrovi]QDZ02711.1 hypothetical protein FQ775_21345 [Nitratireductor mangrovi]